MKQKPKTETFTSDGIEYYNPPMSKNEIEVCAERIYTAMGGSLRLFVQRNERRPGEFPFLASPGDYHRPDSGPRFVIIPWNVDILIHLTSHRSMRLREYGIDCTPEQFSRQHQAELAMLTKRFRIFGKTQ